MTRQRNDKHSTEFGEWLRIQPEIDSKIGYIATNLDYVWGNYKTGEWMLIEEKRYMADVTWSQKQQMVKLHKSIEKIKSKFKGTHLIQFEKTSPEDGKIFLDRQEITKDRLIEFLRFFK